MLAPALRRVATTVLDRFGADVTLRAKLTGTFDTAEDKPAVTDVAYPTRGVFVRMVRREGPTGVVRVGDRDLLVSAEGIDREPDVDWRVQVGGKSFDVVLVEPLETEGEAVGYILTVRG